MPTTTFQKTITVAALRLADATDQEVTGFLDGTGWTLTRGDGGTAVLYPVGQEFLPSAPAKRIMGTVARNRLVKVDGTLRPYLVHDVMWQREFGDR